MKRSRPVRVLFVTGSFDPGGAELHLLRLLRAFDPSWVKCHVIHFAHGDLHKEYQTTSARLHFIDRGNGIFPVKLLRAAVSFRRAVAHIKPDVIHSQLPQTNLLTCFMSGGKYPIVLSERGLGKTRPLWEKLLRKAAYARASFFIANSPVTVRRMVEREGISADKVFMINNIIDFACSTTGFQGIADRTTGEIQVLAVGGLRKVKGFDVLIKAIAILTEEIPGIRLSIAGEGSERNTLEELIKRLNLEGKVKLLGYRNDVSALLANADVFVSSSLSEGQSNAILEAMASGVPVVATSVGGSTALLAGGDAGILVPFADPAALARAIGDCVEGEADTLSRVEKAIELIRQIHSPDVIKQQYMMIYEKLLQSRKTPV